jgi:formiminotetrahydrofolate cyclodeaminase
VKSPTNIIEDVLIGFGITVSLIDIQQVLSIILLVLNVGWLLVKLVLKIVEHVKKKQYDQIDDDIKETIDGIEEIKNHDDDSKE